MRRRSFRNQSGTSDIKGPKRQPTKRDTGGGVVGCVCGNAFICAGYYEYDYMGQFWRNCDCCKRAFEALTQG